MKYVAILCVLLLTACNADDDGVDCSTVLCASPELILQFVDAQTGEDVFVDGPLDIQDLEITDASDQLPVPFRVSQFEGELFVFLETFVAVSTSRSYQIEVDGSFAIDFSFTAVPDNSDDCCPGVNYENLNTDAAGLEQLDAENSYRISI